MSAMKSGTKFVQKSIRDAKRRILRHGPSLLMPVSIFLLALISFSCKEPVTYDNPLDPGVTLQPPTNLQINYISTSYVSLTWTENNVLRNDAQEMGVKYLVEEGTDTVSFDTMEVVNGLEPAARANQTLDADSTYYFQVTEWVGTRLAGKTNIASAKP